MALRERLRVPHELMGLTLAATACVARQPTDDLADGETGDGDALELVSANFDTTGKFVTLHFSKPVAPVDGVEPADFRVSFAGYTVACIGGGDDGCVEQTSYWDPNFYANDYLGYAPGSDERFEVDLVSPGDEATEIVLRFGAPLEPGLCEYIAAYEEPYAFLHVHYSPGDIPITSEDDEQLAAIGPEWVENSFPVMDADGVFPNLDPRVAIPCSL